LRAGHREAQDMFLAMGRALGYQTRRTWSAELPTDGVWVSPLASAPAGGLPIVALEVIVTEGPKTAKGSIQTLAAVSPALGIVCLQDEEIRRGLIRAGVIPQEAERRLLRQHDLIEEQFRRCTQRIELWSFGNLRRRYQVITGRQSLLTA
jgi:hypothetical protein